MPTTIPTPWPCPPYMPGKFYTAEEVQEIEDRIERHARGEDVLMEYVPENPVRTCRSCKRKFEDTGHTRSYTCHHCRAQRGAATRAAKKGS